MKIFVSCEIRDVEFTKQLLDSLRARPNTSAYTVDLYGKNINGLFDPNILHKELAEPDLTLIELSQNYVNNQWMRDEVCGIYLIERYIKSNFIMPILIGTIEEDEIPFCLRGKERVDFRSIPPEIGFAQVNKLASELVSMSTSLPKPGIWNFTRSANAVEIIDQICSRFHMVARELRERYNDRPILVITDEYDVQYLFHALLRIFFSDVRREEWTPSYAGGSSRTDFLLKDEQVIVELKNARPTLKAKELGEQLILDIARYRTHPDCKTLYCFVYDPDGHVANPKGIENDLSVEEQGFNVKVYIGPRLP